MEQYRVQIQGEKCRSKPMDVEFSGVQIGCKKWQTIAKYLHLSENNPLFNKSVNPLFIGNYIHLITFSFIGILWVKYSVRVLLQVDY